MSFTPDTAVFQKSLAALPLASYQPGDSVLNAGSKTGLLLILRKGAVAIEKDGVEVTRVTEPGSVFGELSALLDQPHTANVRALEASQFHVANADSVLQNPGTLLYIAAVLARRLDAANHALIELKSQINVGQPSSVIAKTMEKMESLLDGGGANLAYAGYPFDPYA